MLKNSLLIAPLLAGLAGIFAAGCGGGQSPPSAITIREELIREVGRMYRFYVEGHHKPPKEFADFRPFRDSFPKGYGAIQDDSVVVVWGANLTDLAEEASKDSPDEVLAYEKKVPDEGGTVLMKDRSVRLMSADEFKAAPKARGM